MKAWKVLTALAILAMLVFPISAVAAPAPVVQTGGNGGPPWAMLVIGEDGLSVSFTGHHVKAIDLLVEYCDGTGELIQFEKPIWPPHVWEFEKPVTYADSLMRFWGDEFLTLVVAESRPCPVNADPVLRNFWAYVNPAVDKNICYFFSLTRPTQSEEDNDVRRLCFTETSPNWWDGAYLLTHGDVYEDGSDWGNWQGDAAAEVYNPGSKRLPLHAPAGEQDLFDVAETSPWTQ